MRLLVCNGGLVVAALAVADDEPELARCVLENALNSAPLALATYAPDGGWLEGPSYWKYATCYAVAMMAALVSATGAGRAA